MPATYEPIATTTLGSATATVTFSSIPTTYTDLVLICGSLNAANSGNAFKIEVGNGTLDTGSNYSATYLVGNGTTASSQRNSNEQTMRFMSIYNASANINVIVNFLNYSNTNTYKTAIGRANAPATVAETTVNLWRSTSAINIMKIYFDTSGSNNMQSGSTFTLYGIKAA